MYLFTVIVASVWFLRSKSQDELDKKTNNHLPLPMDYASNEGIHLSNPNKKTIFKIKFTLELTFKNHNPEKSPVRHSNVAQNKEFQVKNNNT